jgi:autotransporter translocation and assembly factor TamB
MSDVYDFDAKTGSVTLQVTDKRAMDLLWALSRRAQAVDPAFAKQVQSALKAAGYVVGTGAKLKKLESLMDVLTELPDGTLGQITQPSPPYRQDLIPVALHGLRVTIETMKASGEK